MHRMIKASSEISGSSPFIETGLQVLGPSSTCRKMTVKPGMCGHNSLFVGQIGDWTWETVSALCATNVFNARNERGAPTYLAFYYFRIKASPALHLGGFSFGDQIAVASRLFNFGSESILTLHRIKMAGDGEAEVSPLDYKEFYDTPSDDCIYVENFNRWISRSRGNSNEDLIKSSPVDFKYAHLPTLPEQYSPRQAYNYARCHQTFHNTLSQEYTLKVEAFPGEYAVDITRDINGVGLIYFAAYFSIIDRAILQLWRHMGRSDESFMKKIILEQKVCYAGNADINSVFAIKTSLWEKAGTGGDEIFNVIIEDRDTRRAIAICTLRVLSHYRGDGTH